VKLSAIASVVVCAVKFVNSFARRQHLFDIAAKPTNVDLNILSCLVPVPISIACREFHRSPFSILAKRKKYVWHDTVWRDRQKPRWTSQKHNASVVAYGCGSINIPVFVKKNIKIDRHDLWLCAKKTALASLILTHCKLRQFCMVCRAYHEKLSVCEQFAKKSSFWKASFPDLTSTLLLSHAMAETFIFFRFKEIRIEH